MHSLMRPHESREDLHHDQKVEAKPVFGNIGEYSQWPLPLMNASTSYGMQCYYLDEVISVVSPFYTLGELHSTNLFNFRPHVPGLGRCAKWSFGMGPSDIWTNSSFVSLPAIRNSSFPTPSLQARFTCLERMSFEWSKYKFSQKTRSCCLRYGRECTNR